VPWEVYVQFWLRLGDPPVEVLFKDAGEEEEVIPQALRLYL